MFSALLLKVRSVAKERHRVAHWCWILSDDLPPDALLLIDPAEQAPIFANMLGYHDPKVDVDRSKIFVLRKQDAAAIVKNIKDVKNLVNRVLRVLWQKDRGERAELRDQLCSEPRMAEALRLLRARRKSTQEVRK